MLLLLQLWSLVTSSHLIKSWLETCKESLDAIRNYRNAIARRIISFDFGDSLSAIAISRRSL